MQEARGKGKGKEFKGGKNKGAAKEKPVDEDPDGVLLATAADPLEKASAYLRTLQLHARGDSAIQNSGSARKSRGCVRVRM